MTKSYDRSSILRAAWASARFVADLVGEPVLRHIGAAMRNCWYIAKNGFAAFADAPPMMPQPSQQQQACAAPRVAMRLVRTVTHYGIIAVDQASVRLCPEFPDHGCDEYRVMENGVVIRTRYVLASDHHHWHCPGAKPFITPNFSKVTAQRTIDAVCDCLAAAPAMVQQPCQQQQARARNAAPLHVRIVARGHLGFPCDPDHADASLWIVTDGQISRDCATHQEALDLADESRGLGYIPAIVPRLPQKGADLRSAMMTYDEAKAACVRATWGRELRGLDKAARTDAARVRLLDLRESGSVDQAVFDRLKAELAPAPTMVPQPCQQQQACAARPGTEPTAPALPPHLSSDSESDHGSYISGILAELMEEPAPPRPTTVMETVVGRAFTDGLMLGRSMAISEIEALFAELIANLRKS